MRTTLNIDEDVLESARYLAKQSHKSVGQIVSELTRLGFKKLEKLGLIPYKAVHGKPVTEAIVDGIRESEGV